MFKIYKCPVAIHTDLISKQQQRYCNEIAQISFGPQKNSFIKETKAQGMLPLVFPPTHPTGAAESWPKAILNYTWNRRDVQMNWGPQQRSRTSTVIKFEAVSTRTV